MERRIYEVTPHDEKKAREAASFRAAELELIEAHRADKAYWKRRRTTYGLAKRDVSKYALRGDPEYYRGRGQGILDRLQGLDYAAERNDSAYNMGYHEGWNYSPNGMRDYIAANPNFAGLVEVEA